MDEYQTMYNDEMEHKASILVVDDEPRLLESVQQILEAAGYRVLLAGDGIEALGMLKEEPVELILADVAMPRMNGYQLYERVRQNPDWLYIPFVFLSARSLDSDVRYGKELGADDYLTKPFEPADLLATVRGKLRRASQLLTLRSGRLPDNRTAEAGMLILGRLRIDTQQFCAWLDERPLSLSVKEFTLLEYLARHANQVHSPQELVRITHNLETDPVEAGALLRPLIRSLRRKLGYQPGDMGCIENVRGVGYRLVQP
jgi:DNA-binding response OmpR family regulator